MIKYRISWETYVRQDKLESTKTEIQGNTASCHTFEGCLLFKGKPNKTALLSGELTSL